jgi:hypothetical protein
MSIPFRLVGGSEESHKAHALTGSEETPEQRVSPEGQMGTVTALAHTPIQTDDQRTRLVQADGSKCWRLDVNAYVVCMCLAAAKYELHASALLKTTNATTTLQTNSDKITYREKC